MAVARKRHLAKAFTWRIIATLITVVITFCVTGSLEAGLSVGAFDVVLKLAAYYFHERAWYKTKWGVSEGPLAQQAEQRTFNP